MNIIVPENVGFCFGVRRAVDLTIENIKKGKKVFSPGNIVHNDDVMGWLRELGLSNKDGDTYVVKAHGLPPEEIRKISDGYNVVDATCPIVLNLFKLAVSLHEQGYEVYVYGMENHDEMIALKGHLPQARIFRNACKVSGKKVAFLSQTTMNYNSYVDFVHDCLILSEIEETLVVNPSR